MKRLLSIFIVFILILSGAYAQEEFLSVQDGAGIISPAVERYITTQNKILFKETGARIIIVTDKDTGELSVTEYAKKLYDELGVKSIGRKNSVFLFICDTANDYCVVVSDGISAALTESYAQKCLVEHMEKDFEKGNYNSAVVKVYNAFGEWYTSKYKVELELTENMKDYNNIIETEKKERELKTLLIVLLSVSAVIGALWAMSYIRRKKRIARLQKKRQERRKRYMQIK